MFNFESWVYYSSIIRPSIIMCIDYNSRTKMAGLAKQVLKKTTGLVGLEVVPLPQQVLIGLYEETLKVLNQFPANAVYKTVTSSLTQERLSIVKSEGNIDTIEAKIGHGQAEQLIVQAEDELQLAKNMLEWKPWESLEEQPPANQWKWPI